MNPNVVSTTLSPPSLSFSMPSEEPSASSPPHPPLSKSQRMTYADIVRRAMTAPPLKAKQKMKTIRPFSPSVTFSSVKDHVVYCFTHRPDIALQHLHLRILKTPHLAPHVEKLWSASARQIIRPLIIHPDSNEMTVSVFIKRFEGLKLPCLPRSVVHETYFNVLVELELHLKFRSIHYNKLLPRFVLSQFLYYLNQKDTGAASRLFSAMRMNVPVDRFHLHFFDFYRSLEVNEKKRVITFLWEMDLKDTNETLLKLNYELLHTRQLNDLLFIKNQDAWKLDRVQDSYFDYINDLIDHGDLSSFEWFIHSDLMSADYYPSEIFKSSVLSGRIEMAKSLFYSGWINEHALDIILDWLKGLKIRHEELEVLVRLELEMGLSNLDILVTIKEIERAVGIKHKGAVKYFDSLSRKGKIITDFPFPLRGLMKTFGLKDPSPELVPTCDISDETWNRKHLGHVFGVDIVTKDLGFKLQMSSCFIHAFIEPTMKSFLRFCVEYDNQLPPHLCSFVTDAMQNTLFHPDDIPNALKRYRSGQPLLISTGHIGHTIVAILYQNRIFYANKGSLTIQPLVGYEINPRKVDGEGLEMILNAHDQRSFDAQMTLFFTIPMRFHPYRKGRTPVRARLFPKDLPCVSPTQKIGNCTYKSLETTILGLMILYSNRKRINKQQPCKLKAPIFYFNKWRYSHRLSLLTDYLNDHITKTGREVKPCVALIRRCFTQLKRDRAKNAWDQNHEKLYQKILKGRKWLAAKE